MGEAASGYAVTSRSWDAATYERASDIQEAWALAILDRLPLRGDETVLDAGCGPGHVTSRLVERPAADSRLGAMPPAAFAARRDAKAGSSPKTAS